jgi:hypothetical protein
MRNEMKWSFYQLWNESLESGKERVLKERRNIWASELGGALIDRYLKMTAVTPTNPPNPRSLRKFEAGNIWEAIVGYVLSRAGILQSRQNWLSFQYPDLLEVTGKLDFVAGGMPDYDKAISIISSEFNWLPPFISNATINIAKKLKEQYPNGLEKIILELKSCSSFMFEKYERDQDASLNHKLQNFHYLKSTKMPEGHVVYISKDDARLIEIGIFNPSPLEDEYKKDIETLTVCINNKTEPSKEKPIEYDGKFYANWKIGYSNYLTMLYGFENQFAFDNTYKPMVERWNRVLGRIKEGKELTDNNKKALDEITQTGFNVNTIIEEHTKKGE